MIDTYSAITNPKALLLRSRAKAAHSVFPVAYHDRATGTSIRQNTLTTSTTFHAAAPELRRREAATAPFASGLDLDSAAQPAGIDPTPIGNMLPGDSDQGVKGGGADASPSSPATAANMVGMALATPVLAATATPTPTPAPSTAVVVNMLNAAPVTLNPDGSTSAFGPLGNAIENNNSFGTTVFADPIAPVAPTPLPIWYAPANNAQYFQNMLNNPQIFSTVAGGIAVIKLYGMVVGLPDATLTAFFAYLAQNNIKLGIEAGPLVAASGQPGYGIESFAGPNDLVAMLTRIKTLGGTLSYIAWDEPLFYGSISTGIDTISQVATQVAASTALAKAIFPNAQFGDIEPVGSTNNDAATLQTWFTAYAKASTTPFSFFQADIATWASGWQTQLANTIVTAHANNMSFGAIINGLDAASNNDAWATQADANAQLILSNPTLRPDYLIIQSWQTYPNEAGNPTVAGTLASVAADVSASEKTALAIPAVAQYNANGFLQSVTWTGGWTALQNGSLLQMLSPTGAVLYQTAWANVEAFAFDPNTATVSLTCLVLTSAVGALPVWQSTQYSLGVGTGGFAMTVPATSASPLTLSLAPASLTGFAGSGITNQVMPTLAGTAQPGATVTLLADDVSFGSATAGTTGAWTYIFGTALTSGVHVIQAASSNPKTGSATQQNYVLSIDTANPLAPTLTLAPGSDSSYPGDDVTDIAQPIFVGVADPDTWIRLAIDGNTVATLQTNLTGHWSYALNTALTVGTHTVSATAVNAAGTASIPTIMQLTIDTATQEAAVTSPDPLFDTAWYLQQHPDIAASGVDPYTQFLTVGWKLGYDPDPFFSTSYYFNTYPDVAAAHIDPLIHFEQYGWIEGRNPSPNLNTLALEKSLGTSPGQDPLITYIQSLEYANAVITAVPNGVLAVSLAHTPGANDLTDDPTLAINATPGATLTITVGTAAPTTVTVGTTGHWNYGYAPATLADGSYTVTVTQTTVGGGTSTATLNMILDRTPPIVTAVTSPSIAGVVLAAGNVATITVTFGEIVQVTGLPTLTLNDGGVATYLAGSGSSALTFAYTVLAGQATIALMATAITLPVGAAIVDAAGNAASLGGAATALAGPVVIETQLPATGPNITIKGAATVTATQSINGYTVGLDGTAAATAPSINATSVVFGSQFVLKVIGAGSTPSYGKLNAAGASRNNGIIETPAGTASGAANLSIALSATTGTTASAGVLTNTGTIDAEAGSTISLTSSAGGSLVNSGNLVANGMMFLGAPVSGTGVITIGAASNASAALEVQGAMSAGQSIVFDTGTLTIDTPGSFLATISNFNAHDRIVMEGVNVTATTYSAGTLLLNGAQAGTLHLTSATGSTLSSGVLLSHNGLNTILTIT